MKPLANFICGLVFAAGLIISGMANPAKVLNFLDITGAWDPSLMFVMAGAVAVTAIGYRLVFGRGKPLLEPDFHLPKARDIDAPLVLGAAIFGIGWGLAGFCPGPALVSLPIGNRITIAFFVAMLIGIVAANFAKRPSSPLADAAAEN